MGYRYTGDKLEQEIGNRRVRELVEWGTEPGGDEAGPDGKKPPWEVRNRNYLERIRKALADALTLSCADKTSEHWGKVLLAEAGGISSEPP